SIVSITILLFAIGFFYFFSQFYFPAFPWVFLFMAILHAFLHVLLLKKIDTSPQKFINAFMLITTLKIFIILISLAALLFFLKNNALQIGITALILFFTYLILEVNILMKNFRK
ncbi:MAG: hypothetical protein DRP35_10360, partial [Candidatus Zixiibacteriota bacterium]